METNDGRGRADDELVPWLGDPVLDDGGCPVAYDHLDGEGCAVCGWSPSRPTPRMDPEKWEGVKAWITALNGLPYRGLDSMGAPPPESSTETGPPQDYDG